VIGLHNDYVNVRGLTNLGPLEFDAYYYKN
jgi:hypothetical protein